MGWYEGMGRTLAGAASNRGAGMTRMEDSSCCTTAFLLHDYSTPGQDEHRDLTVNRDLYFKRGVGRYGVRRRNTASAMVSTLETHSRYHASLLLCSLLFKASDSTTQRRVANTKTADLELKTR